MSRYLMEFTVIQTSSKIVNLEVDAADEEEAEAKAAIALNTYPREIMEDGIHRILVKREEYELPSFVNMNMIRQDKRFG